MVISIGFLTPQTTGAYVYGTALLAVSRLVGYHMVGEDRVASATPRPEAEPTRAGGRRRALAVTSAGSDTTVCIMHNALPDQACGGEVS